MATLEAIREEIESIKTELAEAKTQVGYSINSPGVVALNLRLIELYKKEERFSSSVSGKS